jgi:hypothetical protein
LLYKYQAAYLETKGAFNGGVQYKGENLDYAPQGGLVPDVIIYEGNDPLKIAYIFDFKFPCSKKKADWPVYGEKSQYNGYAQNDVYNGVLKPSMGSTIMIQP